MTLTIDIRDKRLRGGRLVISARTSSKPLFRRREAAVRALLERGEIHLIESLRNRSVRIEEVQNAWERQDIESLRRIDDGVQTLGDVLERVMVEVRATCRKGTVAVYERLVKQLLEWKGKGFDIGQLPKDDAAAWMYEAKETVKKDGKAHPWSPNKQLQTKVLCGRIWDAAIQREMEIAELTRGKPRFTRNVWKLVEVREPAQPRKAYLQPEEWKAVLGKVRGTPKAAALGLGAYAGLRQQEMANLRTDIDVDLGRRLIHVQPRDSDWSWEPKNLRGTRTLDIADELYELLVEHREYFAGERFFVRTIQYDQPMTATTVVNWTKAAFEAAGLRYGMKKGDGLTYHSLRHTFASWLVQDGVSPMIVAELLGDTYQMVVKVYGHLAPRNLKDAIERVGRIGRGDADIQ